MSDGSVKPAMDAEEWDRGEVDREGWYAEWGGDPRSLTVGHPGASGGYGLGVVPESEVHALAALALHGQPYGFTWDDVDRCRRAADRAEAEHDNPDGEMYMELAAFEEAEAWNHLADRIESLLPQREET